MLVVSDTSPITNLIQIGQLNLLRQLFHQVVIPQMVYNELCEIPYQKKELTQQPWIIIQAAKNKDAVKTLSTELDPGEAEAIALALELKADYLVIDEWKGRNKAESLGLRIVGLIGTLLQAKQKGLISAIKPFLIELKDNAGFRINPTLYQYVLSIAGEAD